MNEKMREVQASLHESVRVLQELQHDARDSGSRHADAIAVLTRMVEAAADAAQDVSDWVSAEVIGAEDSGV